MLSIGGKNVVIYDFSLKENLSLVSLRLVILCKQTNL